MCFQDRITLQLRDIISTKMPIKMAYIKVILKTRRSAFGA